MLSSHNEDRLPALDGVRGIAIFLVLIFHSYGFGIVHMQGWVWQVAQGGWVGVDLFFVLSGFLITRILLRARGRRGYFRVFYARRILRIIPSYYISIGVVLALGLTIPALGNDSFHELIRDQVWLWTFTTNLKMTYDKSQIEFGWFIPGTWYFLTHLWSLAVEEQFYLLWPLLIAICRPRWLPVVIAAICLAAPLTRLGFIADDNLAGAYMFMVSRADTLAAGAFLAILESRGRLQAIASRTRPTMLIVGVGILILGALRGRYTTSDTWVIAVGYSLNALFFASVLGYVLTRPSGHRWIRILESRVLRFLGKYSYTVYICHMMLAHPLLMHYIHHGDDVIARVGSYPIWLSLILIYTLLTSYLVAVIAWNLYEQPILNLKRYFPYPR